MPYVNNSPEFISQLTVIQGYNYLDGSLVTFVVYDWGEYRSRILL